MEKEKSLGIEKRDKIIKSIQQKRRELTNKLAEHHPAHFKIRDLIHDFFASLIFGMTLIFKGNLFGLTKNLSVYHLIAIVISTVIILTVTIYFTSYKGLRDRLHGFFNYWLEKFIGYYSMAIIVSVFLVLLFGLNIEAESGLQVLEMIMALSMPCAIGAAVPSLLKEY